MSAVVSNSACVRLKQKAGEQRAPAFLLFYRVLGACLLCIALPVGLGQAIQANPTNTVRILHVAGPVEVSRAGAVAWDRAYTNQVLYTGDRLRTGERSKALLQMRDNSVIQVQELTVLTIPPAERRKVRLQLLKGLIYFFNRDRPGEAEVDGPGVWAVVRGTEFTVQVCTDGTTILTLIDGQVDMTNALGRLELSSGQVGTAKPDSPPARTAVLSAGDWQPIQWFLYYPAVLNLMDLEIPEPDHAALAKSLDTYRAGNLLGALEEYPPDAPLGSQEGRLYLAALLLSVGKVDESQIQLAPLRTEPHLAPIARALDVLAAAVQFKTLPETPQTETRDRTSTEWLAWSYYYQSRRELRAALDSARKAVELSQDFGFGWARVAELEFSFGHARAARAALKKAISLSPRNAQAVALQGFVFAAQNQVDMAQQCFEEAIALDGCLANGWLGRGLCRIQRGDAEGGRRDLQVAAATEPQRAVLRSYLSKAFDEIGDFARARHELDLAKNMDPGDPTAWLYAALLYQRQNLVNAAVTDLERSTALNDNRAIYRSQLLLDQDRAVRSANLANVYADAGFNELSVREATRAVNADYANAAAHLFLANSYDALRDPRQINLRYETPWLSEFLLANILAPVSASPLSQTISQNEYTSLFEHHGLGVINQTAWASNGDWLERGAQFGRFGNFAYALDAYYRVEVGQRINADLEQLALTASIKQQLGPADSLFFQATWYDAESGDVLQRYDPGTANSGLRIAERHEPLIAVGFHHEWQPGAHTLLLISPWNNTLTYRNPQHESLLFIRDDLGEIGIFMPVAMPMEEYRSRFTAISAELQQICQTGPHTLIGGARYQTGEFDVSALVDTTNMPDVNAQSGTSPAIERLSFYGYDQLQITKWLLLTAGVSYDRLTQPTNFRTIPLSGGEQTDDLVSPKAGVTLSPWRGAALRGAYTHSLSGVSLDQSLRLEPVQVAGFNQAYRSLIPEPITGSVSAQTFQTWGVAFDQKLPTCTYITIAAEQLGSDASRAIGAFEYLTSEDGSHLRETTLSQNLDFTERSIAVTIGQLASRDFAFTACYRLSEAQFETALPDVPAWQPGHSSRRRSVLNQIELAARFNHPCGFFARWESVWTRQSNHDDVAHLAGDNFWQHNLSAGWRFHRRHAEVAVGILNITDQDYQLYPLNYYAETYRDRTAVATVRFSF
jgi:Tfp pilus assembly protein PilF